MNLNLKAKKKQLTKLEARSAKFKREENEQILQLKTWLSENQYVQTETEWQEQLELLEELKDKLSELKADYHLHLLPVINSINTRLNEN